MRPFCICQRWRQLCSCRPRYAPHEVLPMPHHVRHWSTQSPDQSQIYVQILHPILCLSCCFPLMWIEQRKLVSPFPPFATHRIQLPLLEPPLHALHISLESHSRLKIHPTERRRFSSSVLNFAKHYCPAFIVLAAGAVSSQSFYAF